jgi:hypothetical protein
MEERKIFGVAIRIGGFVFILYSMLILFYVVAKLLGIATRSQMSLAGDIWGFAFFFLIGIALVRGGGWIVQFAYGLKDKL